MGEINYLSLFLEEAVDIIVGWEKSCLDFERSGSTEDAEGIYRAAHNLKSGSSAAGLREFNQFVHGIEDLLSALLKGKVQRSPRLMRLLFDTHTVLANWLEVVASAPDFIPTTDCQRIAQEAKRILAGDDVVPFAAAPLPKEEISDPKPARKTRKSHNMRVSAAKLDVLIDLVGELSTQQAIVWHGRQKGLLQSKSCDNAIQLIQRAAKELQSVALSLRMQPLQVLFQRLERGGHDLARSLGKKISMTIQGQEIELDKAVIERITEGLLHLVRNAVDHGIEDPVTRKDAGKPEVATLSLLGSQEPGGILITISDDGKGLNLDKILSKAIEVGLARPDQKYSQAEIQRFIFSHGFSTADKVTDVSGRGVGMDVVKTLVQSIGGSISVTSIPGAGTNFAISLPATLSIVDSLIIELNQKRYAVPIQDVSEIVDISNLKIETAASRGRLLSLRQSVIPVEYLRDHLPPDHNPVSLSERKDTSWDMRSTIKPALVIQSGANTLAFQIDHIAGQQPVSVRPLPIGLDRVPGFTGGTILGDGDPCVILNLQALAHSHIEAIMDHEEHAKGTAPVSESKFSTPTLPASAPEERHLILQLCGRLLATPLQAIREILSPCPAMPIVGAPRRIKGCIDVRGQTLIVVELHEILGLHSTSSVLPPMIVVENAGAPFAVTVDQVEAVADVTVETLVGADLGTFGAIPDLISQTQVVRFNHQIIPIIDLQRLSSEAGVAEVRLLETV